MKIEITLSVLFIFALSPIAHAVSPAPDGGYSGGNTAEGQNALFSLTTGVYNTAVGLYSLESNAVGNANTAIGAGALFATTADQNTATGAGALFSNSTGEANAAHGAFALFDNTDGSNNTANGVSALLSNTIGAQNTAIGEFALFHNITGDNNTAAGVNALFNNTTGGQNTAIGVNALEFNTTGSGNIALGVQAGNPVTTANNVICIGATGANIDNSCFIGNIYSNVQPVIGINPDYVTIDSNGRLGRSNLNGSSRRFKHDIQLINNASEVIFALKPVSFRYNKEYDATQRLSFGLIAEEVAEVAPNLVGRNKNGEPNSVRYEQINAMLLNEFLKEHKKVQQLEVAVTEQRHDFETTIAALKKEVERVAARSKDQDEKIQKVSAQVEVKKPARTIVVKD
jgi:hypothetical protein